MYDKAYAFLEEENLSDRRRKKTVFAIKYALLQLLQEKELEDITISELSEKADVNRKTFYNHYQSVEEVAETIDKNFCTYIFSLLPEQITIQNTIEIYHFLQKINEIWTAHKDIISRNKKILQSGYLQEHISGRLEPYIRKCLQIYKVSEHIVPYISSYILHGLAALYLQWLQDDTLTTEQLTLLSYNLILSSLHLDNFKDIVQSK